MRRTVCLLGSCWWLPLATVMVRADVTLDVLSVPPDLVVPPIAVGAPAPGRRVLEQLPAYAGTEIRHSLYLPTDWKPGARYPVIVEYLGLRKSVTQAQGYGYGVSGGNGYIWVVLPYVASGGRAEAPTDGRTPESWWGNPRETAAYAETAVPHTCRQWGGDPQRVVLVGYSRGAIACNFIGLHNDRIARLWCAIVADSHYEGHPTNSWSIIDTERVHSVQRLRRLGGTPQWIGGELNRPKTNDLERLALVQGKTFPDLATAIDRLGLVPQSFQEGKTEFVRKNFPEGRFTIVDYPWANHSSEWVMRDVPLRAELRRWLEQVLARQVPTIPRVVPVQARSVGGAEPLRS